MEFSEIAVILGRNVNAVRRDYRNGMRRLFYLLQKSGVYKYDSPKARSF